jgi:glycosyltransferase involved in cell wall biosynthesis
LGSKVIYDVHENIPDQVQIKSWLPKWSRPMIGSILGAVERVVGSGMLDGIVAATPLIARRFAEAKTCVVCNFPESEFLRELIPYEGRRNDIVYVGGLSGLRGLREMIEAVATLPESFGARLILAGRFESEAGQREVQHRPGWARTQYLGVLSRAEIATVLNSSKIGLCILHRAPNITDAYPTKVFEYMAAGLPVVLSDFLVPDILAGLGCAVSVDPKDVSGITRVIAEILADPANGMKMGAAGRDAVRTQFNWTAQERTLLAFYEMIIKGGSGDGTLAAN